MNAKLFLKNSLREEEKSTIEERSHLLRFAVLHSLYFV